MGRRWCSALGWLLLWSGAYALVYRWGLWWWFVTTMGMACCLWLLLGRTIALLYWRGRAPAVYETRSAPQVTGQPRRIRRAILEEEEVLDADGWGAEIR